MNNEIYQEIFDLLSEVLPADWKKFVLYVAYTPGSFAIKYYTRNENGIYTDCFSQQKVSRAQLVKIFMEIDKRISLERNLLEDNNKWNVMTMIVDSNGRIKVDYDYVDISENSIDYEKKWKAKYINS